MYAARRTARVTHLTLSSHSLIDLLNDVRVDPPGAISDHALVVSSIPVSVDSPPLSERLVRGWRRVDRDQLASLLLASPLCSATPPVTPNTDVDELFDTYNRVLLDLANQLAPSHVIRRRPGRPTPWFDADCREHRRECHRLERRYRRTYRPDDRRRWVERRVADFVYTAAEGGVLVESFATV